MYVCLMNVEYYEKRKSERNDCGVKGRQGMREGRQQVRVSESDRGKSEF